MKNAATNSNKRNADGSYTVTRGGHTYTVERREEGTEWNVFVPEVGSYGDDDWEERGWCQTFDTKRDCIEWIEWDVATGDACGVAA